MKKNVWKLLVGVMAAAMMLSGCGNSSDMTTSNSISTGSSVKSEYATESFEGSGLSWDSAEMEQMRTDGEIADSSSAKQDPLDNRKLIKTVDMTVETKEFDVLLETLETKVIQMGGYIENLETYNGSAYSGYRNKRNANLTIRIPQNSLSAFLEEVGSISNIIRRTENVQDITLTYVDLESHKMVLEAERDRLIELIDQAQELEDILTIEGRLTEVRYQLESMESKLRTYDNKINYSTITLNVNEVLELTPVEEETTWQRMTGGFVESLKKVGHGLAEFFIWFFVSIPYFVVWGTVIVLIIFLIKGLKKNRKSVKKSKEVTTSPGQTQNEEQKK